MTGYESLVPYAKIGKSKLIRAIGVQENYNQIEYISVKDKEICGTAACPNFDLFNKSSGNRFKKEKDTLCLNCSVGKTLQKKTHYKNEKHAFKISHASKRLSKLEIKLLLLYHFMSCDKIGMIKNIHEKELASLIGCTVRSVKNINTKLLNLGYIILSHSGDGRFNVILTEYKKYHLPAFKGGTGYFYMPLETLQELFMLDDVNAVRLSLRNLINHDSNKYEPLLPSEKETSKISYKSLKKTLPQHINSVSKIKELSKKAVGIFEFDASDEFVSYRLKKEHDPEHLRKIKAIEFRSIFNNVLIDFGRPKSLKDVEDMIQMTEQYGFTRVNAALERMYQYQQELKHIELPNFGGYLRAVIEDSKRVSNVA